MNDLQRFKAIVHGQMPDYIPIFGFPGAPGAAGGCMEKTHDRLIETGMPATVGGVGNLSTGVCNVESWQRYWGTTGPIGVDFFPGEPAKGIQSHKRIEGEWEIIEYETGAVTKQVLENDITYSMPEFIKYPIRDERSWKKFRDLSTPGEPWSKKRLDQACAAYDNRDKPLSISVGGTWGVLRSLMGTVDASYLIYDQPGLLHEIMEWFFWKTKTYIFPLIKRLKPEIIQAGEDICYKSGMLIHPMHFMEFCAPFYKKIGELAGECGTDLLAVDTDGNAMEFVDTVSPLGVNGVFPFEVKAGNDCFAIRKKYPSFVLFGWLEKEICNLGGEWMIRNEIMGKVPSLLKTGRYFPNLDHGIQPFVTFKNLCRCMTLLHHVTGNPEGEYPKIYDEVTGLG